jgi:hypothetical protein|tara:strand:- start:303 stop:443 length:141 start_codon:yes stop_codon:yes gene_type:complete
MKKLLRNIKTNEANTFKPYQIGNLPNYFNKYKNVFFNKSGLTYIKQ